MNATGQSADVSAAKAAFEHLDPDPRVGRGVAQILANSIKIAHETNIEGWETGYDRPGPTLVAGRLFAVHCYSRGRLSLLVLEEELRDVPPKIRSLLVMDKDWRPRSLPGANWSTFELCCIDDVYGAVRDAHEAAVRRATGAVRRTPYRRHHNPALVEHLREELRDRRIPQPA
jgi:hypothetical protein